MITFYPAISIIGGTDEDLDGYPSAELVDGDTGIVITPLGYYIYVLDDDIGSPVENTYNPADKDSDISLSNGDLTATADAGGWKSVRSISGKSTGKWYWEISVDEDGGSPEMILGFGDSAVPVTGAVGVGNSWGYRSNGQKAHSGYTVYGDSYAKGDVISIALDLDNHKVWWAKNGVWQNSGDPVAGTDEAFEALPELTYYVMDSPYQINTEITVNCGPTGFIYSPPAGFYPFVDSGALPDPPKLVKPVDATGPTAGYGWVLVDVIDNTTLDNDYILRDGSLPLTADWNIGNYQLGIGVNPSYPLHLEHTPGDENFKQMRGYANPTGSLTAAYDHYGVHEVVNSFIDRGAYQYNLYGGYFSAGMTGGSATTVNGVVGAFSCGSSPIIQIGRGVYSICSVNAPGTIDVHGVHSSMIFSFDGNATTAYGLRSYINLDTSGTVGTAYGTYNQIIQSSGTLTTAYLFYGAYSGTIGTKWGIYLNGENQNYLSGILGIGASPLTGSALTLGMATADLEFRDSDVAGGTNDGWIEIEIGGVTRYIRVYTTK